MRRTPRLLAALAVCGALVAGAAAATATPGARLASAPELRNWPEFGLNPQRTDTTADSTGITAANLRGLRRLIVQLPGTPDNSAIYLHGALVDGARHDVAIVTTSYGITLAIDANSGAILWRFDPRPGALARERPVHDRHADRNRELRLRDLAKRPRPQARDRRRPRGAGLAGQRHPRAEDREDDAVAERR